MENMIKYVEKFKEQVYNRGEEIDPNDDYDWFSLSYGWALGQGLTVKTSYDFAILIWKKIDQI